jgi:two-component system, cell cycle sensor histidine kinase and response regulator CckA
VDNANAFPASSAPHQRPPAWAELRRRDEKLEALKDLLDHLAHDFNNMLVPILGYITLIKEDLNRDCSSLKYAAKIEHSARNTEGLMERILAAVRPQRCFNPTVGDLAQVLEKVLAKWQAALPATSQIQVQAALVACPLLFDQALLAALFEQLLSNARYALALGGLLKISLRPKILNAQQARELNISPNTYELVISDNGFGISPEVLPRVCEPFFSTRPRGQALGLGLTSVHSIALLHGGRLLIESVENAGTTITIWFPTEGPRSVPAKAPVSAARQRSAVKRGSKVLLVDADPFVREVIKTGLQRLSVEVALAQDGADALKVFQRNMSQFGLIVSDISLPKMNGPELFEQVRKLDPDVPFVWLCGDPAARDDLVARFGSKHPLVIEKPFTLKAFAEIVRTHLAG